MDRGSQEGSYTPHKCSPVPLTAGLAAKSADSFCGGCLGLPLGARSPGELSQNVFRYILEASWPHQLLLLVLTVAIFLLEVVPLELQRRAVNEGTLCASDRSSARLAARRCWIGAFVTIENAAALEWRLAVTGNVMERDLFVDPASTAIVGTSGGFRVIER
jgi:hypothetical protein